jgi:hypothetical protein
MKDLHAYLLEQIKDCKELIDNGHDYHQRLYAFMDVLEELEQPEPLPHNMFDDMQVDVDNFFTAINKVMKR